MEFQPTLYTLLYLLAGLITLIPVWTGWRMRTYPGVYALFWMMLAISGWAFLCGFEMTLVNLEAKRVIVIFEDCAFVTFNGMLLLFVLDYFSIGGRLSARLRRSLWLLPALIFLLDVTNAWHGLVYSQYFAGPPGSNLLLLTPGPVYYAVTLLLYLIDFAMLGVTGYFALRKSSPKRTQAAFIFLAIFSAWLGEFIFVLLPDQPAGLGVVPVGFVVCGMLVSWVVFEDLLRQVFTQAGELRRSRDNLAARLKEQQQKVGGLYALVYLRASREDQKTLIHAALGKMRETIGCDAIAYFIQAGDQYILDAQAGLAPGSLLRLDGWPVPADARDPQVFSWPGLQQNTPLPLELRQAGYHSAAAKSIQLSSGQCASILYLWQGGHPLTVDELPLIGAQADVLAMILENDRSRQMLEEWASLQERQHLRRELHDRISQDLFSLSIFGANGVRHATAGKTAALLDDLNAINLLAQHVLNEMRLLLFELQPQSLTGPLHLEELIQKRFAIVEAHINLQTELVVSGCEGLPPHIAKTLYGVVIEALNNIVKYANAKNVSIRIEAAGDQVQLEIRDDGAGFDPQAKKRHGLGLANMRERVAQINGSIQILSQPGQGTLIQAALPMAVPA